MDTGTLKRFAIIHLGEIKDLIFLAPSLVGLKAKYPNSQIHLFANKNSISILNGWEILDCVYPIDTDLDNSSEENLLRCAKMISQINFGLITFDTVVNLSINQLSFLLASHIPAKLRFGGFINNDHELQINDPWSQYNYAIIGKSILNPFHLSDLYRYILQLNNTDTGLEIPPYEEQILHIRQKIAFETGLKIGLTITELWPLAQIISCIEDTLALLPKSTFYLLNNGDKKSDRSGLDVKKIKDSLATKNNQNRLIDLTRYDQIMDIHAICNEMHLVVGCLTTTTHLATASGTFTISLGFLNQEAYEAGPYGHGHVAILDENQDSKTFYIPSQIIADAIKFAVTANNKKPPRLEQWKSFFVSCNIDPSLQWKPFFAQRTIFTQHNGSERIDLIYEPIINRGASAQEVLWSIYRLVWQFELNESEDALSEVRITRVSTLNGLIQLVDTLEKLHKLGNFGISYTKFVEDDIIKKDTNLMKADSDRLQEIDNVISRIATEIPAVFPICNFYIVHQFQNRSSTALAAEYARQSYQRMQFQIAIILDLIQEITSGLRAPKEVAKEI